MKYRQCIFCGNAFTGQKRNFEHVLPSWLVREADLKRRTTSVTFRSKSFDAALSRIGGQSCEACNNNSASLEQAAQSAYIKVRDGIGLSQEDGCALLDWLDKVRTGLWLWSLSAGKGDYDFEPKFHISARLAAKDRLALISKYRPGPPMKGLEIWGASDYFMWSPSAIGFLINNVSIVSISSDLLIAKHLRQISFSRRLDDTDYETVDIKESPAQTPRLRIMGNPTVIGQYIVHDQIFEELQLETVGNSTLHPSTKIGPILRFDSILKSGNPDLGCIETFTGSKDAHIALMQMNLELSVKFLLDDWAESDFSEVTDEQDRRGMQDLAKHFSNIAEINIVSLRRIYERASGIRLPI